MAGNKPINKPLRGIRDSIPGGYILGRTGAGNGPPILIPAGTFTTKGFVANTTIQVNGPAGGDLSGTYPNPTVAKIQGNAVKNVAPTDGQSLVWIGANSDWEPAFPAPASVKDDGTSLYLALSDDTGQLVLDASGNPIFEKEVLPSAALPLSTSSTVGGVQVDGFSIRSIAGIIGTLFSGFLISPGNQTFTNDATYHTLANVGAATIDTQGGYTVASGLFKPTKAGKYLVFVFGYGGNNGAGTIVIVNAAIGKNGNIGGAGTLITLGRGAPADAGVDTSGLSAVGLTTMNGTTDTLELDLYSNISGGGANAVFANGGWGAIYLGA